jgi:FkbM family methyltransferase
MNKTMRSARVAMSLPVRIYLRRFPLRRGKSFITRRVLKPLLPPPPSTFVSLRPDGSKVELYYREVLGLSTIAFGQFEDAECRLLCQLARPGSTAIDVGANVGIMTIPMARAVGSVGTVVAVEPFAHNIRRLQANATLNSITNIVVRQVAASQDVGHIDFHIAEDPAFGSTRSIVSGMKSIGVISVDSMPLDKIWFDLGSPTVSVIKIDVEGAEAAVIRGTFALLQRDCPVLVLEASTQSDLAQLAELLGPHGYSEWPAAGFMPWNHLFASDRVIR